MCEGCAANGGATPGPRCLWLGRGWLFCSSIGVSAVVCSACQRAAKADKFANFRARGPDVMHKRIFVQDANVSGHREAPLHICGLTDDGLDLSSCSTKAAFQKVLLAPVRAGPLAIIGWRVLVASARCGT